MNPFYDVTKSYEENYDHGPFSSFADPSFVALPVKQKTSFMGFTVDLPFGIPAGPLLNSRYLTAAWRAGFSINTYKTVRSDVYPCHPFPNVIKVKGNGPNIHPGETVIGSVDMASIDINHDGITNSFAVPSKPAAYWQQDVKKALSAMTEGKVLIVSFMGIKKEEMTRDQYIADFAKAYTLAQETGAPIFEVNLSCPNFGKEGLICNDLAMSHDVLEALHGVKKNTPLLVKIGYFEKEQQKDLEQLLAAIHAFTDGVVAINTISAKVVDEHGNQALPGSPVRLFSGTCGATIRWAGVEMAERIVELRKQKGWKNFTVVGVGGVVKPEDYFSYMKLGVDAVQAATGPMWKPDLAMQIRKQL